MLFESDLKKVLIHHVHTHAHTHTHTHTHTDLSSHTYSHTFRASWGAVRYIMYMLGEIQYGGRVTDDYNKLLLITYAKVTTKKLLNCASSTQYNTAIVY